VSWSLRSVRLYSSTDTGREINITQGELREIRQKPFVVNWAQRGDPASAVENR